MPMRHCALWRHAAAVRRVPRHPHVQPGFPHNEVPRPFILPSVFASRIRPRLRPAASHAPRAKRCLKGGEGAAGAARWWQKFCTVVCNPRTCVGAIRQHRLRGTEHARSAGRVQTRTWRGRTIQFVQTREVAPFMAYPRSTTDARDRSPLTHRQDRSSGYRTTPDGHC